MFKPLATLALVVALSLATATATAQHGHGHGHSHVGHSHLGHGHNHVGGLGFGSLGFGYRPYSYSTFYPGFSYGYYPTIGYGWPYYGAYYAYPGAYVLGASPYYLQSSFTYSAPQTTIITLPNAAANAPVAAAAAPNAAANMPIAAANVNARVAARPVEVQFGGFAQLGELSARLVRLANELCLDLHYNYEHNAGFIDTYRAAYQIFDTAKFIAANQAGQAGQGDHQEIARRVNELDALFHQVQADVKTFRRRSVRQIAGTGLQTKLNEVERTLHDLMQDVGVLGTHGAPPPAADPPLPPQKAEVAPPPGPPLPGPPLPAPNPPQR